MMVGGDRRIMHKKIISVIPIRNNKFSDKCFNDESNFVMEPNKVIHRRRIE